MAAPELLKNPLLLFEFVVFGLANPVTGMKLAWLNAFKGSKPISKPCCRQFWFASRRGDRSGETSGR